METNKKTNADRFLDAHAFIERRMNEIYRGGRYTAFSQLLVRCSRMNRVIQYNMEALREYNELRNAIVHQRGRTNEIIAQPTDTVTEDIERIARLLEKDDSILTFASKPVKVLKPTDSITYAYRVMNAVGTAKIPVYEDEKYRGFITLEAIAGWLINGNDPKRKVSELIEAPDGSEKVVFLRKSDSVQSAVTAFENAMNNGITLYGILITERGMMNEIPLGIITVKDLPKIMNSFI